ncbi:MAG: hypothetical protein KA234_00415 [Saprospiraceae bacterium]|nr:hypothetical protein [Saprospiraceae bacterium]
MKQLFFSLLLLLSFSMQSQTTYIKCVSYQNFKSSDCQGCGIKEGVFAGLILESSSGIKHALHSPFQVKYSRNNVTITDAYGTVVTRPVASLVMRGAEGRNLNTFLSDCLCNPSTHYVQAITGDFVDLTNPMTPVIAIDSSQILPAGGSARAVLIKSSGTDYDVEWSTEPKIYAAIVTEQSGTDAPAVTVLKNTLGGEIVWSYHAIGQYKGTLVGAFPQNKTVVLHNVPFSGFADEIFISVTRTNNDEIGITVRDVAFLEVNGLANLSIKIEVYP